jgi:hypothetical protein
VYGSDQLAENANADTAVQFYETAENTYSFITATLEAGTTWEA